MEINLDTTMGDIAVGTTGVTSPYDDTPDDSPSAITNTKSRRIDVKRSHDGSAALFGMAMPNGEFAILTTSDFRRVLNIFIKQGNTSGVYSATEVRRFLVKRARQLGLVKLLPSDWGVTMEITADTGISDLALPVITTKNHLRSAIRRFTGSGTRKGVRVRAHIIKRAKVLGATSMLPSEWLTTEQIKPEEKMEDIKLPETFTSFLVLEGEVPKAIVLEQTDSEKESGTLRVKMPFYVGESITKIPAIPRRIYFPTSLLSETIKEGNAQIKRGNQPLTIYARHAHALASDHLPIGAITGFEQEGRMGYAILEIEPTTEGKDAQILLRKNPPKLNAISLRSGPNRFELEEVTVNGELMFRPTKLFLDGVDFAPDSPAMATYGMEILAAEARVEPVIEEKKKEVQPQVDEITLEAVRAKPEIVEAIEQPLLKRLDDEIAKVKNLTAEVGTLREKDARNALNVFVADMASKHPKKDEALKLFTEIAAECKTKEEFAARILPHFVDAAAEIKPSTAETLETKLKKFFNPTPATTLVEEGEEVEPDNGIERVGALEVPN